MQSQFPGVCGLKGNFKQLHVYHRKFSDFSGYTPRIMLSFYVLYVYISIVIVIFMIITGAVYISQLLKITHTLQELNMYNNDISDDGMAVISEALQHNNSLTILDIRQCGLSVKGTVVCKMYYDKMLVVTDIGGCPQFIIWSNYYSVVHLNIHRLNVFYQLC